jgi:hypothetical protein
MTVITENKRRVVAGLITVVVLLAIGFGVGRVTDGTATAQAAAAHAVTTIATVTMPATRPSRAPAGSLKRLQARLASAHRAETRLWRDVKTRRHVAAQADSRVRRVRRCERDHEGARMARCLRATVGK